MHHSSQENEPRLMPQSILFDELQCIVNSLSQTHFLCPGVCVCVCVCETQNIFDVKTNLAKV